MRYDVLEEDSHTRDVLRIFDGRVADGDSVLYAPRTFLICFTNRCGSTLICSALSQLGVAGKPNEFKNYEFLNSDAVAASVERHGHTSFEAYLRHCAWTHAGDAGAWTLKASPRQLNFLIESGVLARMTSDLTVIHVERTNTIAQAISFVLAAHDGRWTSLHEPELVADPVLDEAQILRVGRDIQEQNALFRLLFELHGVAPLHLRYEDFASDPERLVGQLSRAFGLTSHVRPSALPVRRQVDVRKNDWERQVRSAAASISDLQRTTLTPPEDRMKKTIFGRRIAAR